MWFLLYGSSVSNKCIINSFPLMYSYGDLQIIFACFCKHFAVKIFSYNCFYPFLFQSRFDVQSKHTFIGDSTGQITMIKLEDNGYKPITTFKGHTDAVRCLAWSPERQMLFSGSYDKMIICWDIGGKRGTAYELQGHK